MNKLGVKVYSSDYFIIDEIHYGINSIKYFKYQYQCHKIRYINYDFIGIKLYIIYNKK